MLIFSNRDSGKGLVDVYADELLAVGIKADR
jgi:hypothetical protein